MSGQAAALAEVRPPVGSQVAIARFDIIRHLRLLDSTAFDGLVTPGSIFDTGYIRALEKAGFLRTLPVPNTVPDLGAILRTPIHPQQLQWDGWMHETLEIAQEEIEIHIIKAVEFRTERHLVCRHQWEDTANTDF